ncbi:MAG TPA: tRNA (adenosine(37)-N6)-threonylcarbamoyltransferase complex dimerization subunit type 1 TsaB [Clostridiales bacterium]|nr:tRNA (adenosine(37)-N6)-threonylcarbamoyltransferase complex dimerization subunit type 1 TsaB [Clostridiales bacterium]
MKILAFDCSSKTMAAAIGEGPTVLAAAEAADNRNHAPYLMPMIDGLLAKTEMKPQDIDVIGVTVGPGSFTGLRIGIATAKGFGDMLNIPLIPLSSLDALALNYKGYHGILVPILDARKSQVYAAVYDNRNGEMKKILKDTAVSPLTELAAELGGFDDILFFGDAVENWRGEIEECYGERCSFGVDPYHGIRGEALIALTAGAERAVSSEELLPVYLRSVDAVAKFADFTVDEMKAADIEELLVLEKTAFPVPWTENMFKNELTNAYGHYWVLRSNQHVTAYGGFWLVCDECHITNIAVHEDFRRQGQGKAILEHLIQMAQLYGAHDITLEVRPSNEAALTLYKSHGFLQKGLRKHYYEDNGEDAIIMWLHLPDMTQKKPWR